MLRPIASFLLLTAAAPALAHDLAVTADTASAEAAVADENPVEDARIILTDTPPYEGAAPGYDAAAALAQQLANPVASLISVPIQFNFDGNIGPADDGTRVSMLVQPVIPFRLSENWNLISRTIVPVVWQKNIFPGSGTQFGLSDTAQSLFISPAKPGSVVWGFGPVVLIPTGTDDLLSGRKWGAGPSALLLKQTGPWTMGLLANQVWSFAGNSQRADISQALINPFLIYTTPTALALAVAVDATRDWENKRWTVPVRFNISQVTMVGSQLVQVGGGLIYYAKSNVASPSGLAARFTVTLLFPR